MKQTPRTCRRIAAALALLALTACGDEAARTQAQTPDSMSQKLYLTIGGETHAATLYANTSAEALVAALREAPIAYEAHDYGGFEKVGDLGRTLPRNDEDVTTAPGDLILYLGHELCIYYATNTWDFTRLGRLDGMTQAEVKRFVHAGGGNVTVTLSLEAPSALGAVPADGEAAAPTYTPAGTRSSAADAGGIAVGRGGKQLRKPAP